MAEPIPAPPPEVPITVLPALLTITKLSALFVVLGAIAAVRAVIDAGAGFVGSIIGRIPIIGGAFSNQIGRWAQDITNKMGRWIVNLDDTYGGFFLALSTITAELAQGQIDSAFFDFVHAKKFSGVNDPSIVNKRVTKAINKASAAVATANSGIVTNTRENHIAVAKAKAVAHSQSVGLAGELDHVIEWDIPRLRARTKAIEHGLSRAWEWIRAHPLAVPEAVAASAVAVALARLDLSWIRCRNWKRIGKSICGLPFSLLEDLLATAIIALAATDICDFANAAESLALRFQPALFQLVDVENALVGCHGATAAPALTLPALHLPPTNLGLPLAA